MAGKKKSMNGGGEDTKIFRMLKELDELHNLLTKQDQGMFNKVRFGSRLKDFFEILKKILSEHLLSKVYRDDLKTQLEKLLELFVKFKNISSIKNGGSQGILNLFRANILWMTQEAREIFTELSQKITSNIYLLKNGHTNQPSVTKHDIESVEYYFDFVIGLIRLLVTTFKKNTNTANFELAEVKKLFDIMIEQYLNYLNILGTHTEYLPANSQISNILSKRQLTSVANYKNQMNKLKNTFFPNIQRVESLLSKNVIMNVLQKIKGSFNAGLTPNQIQLKIKSLQQFKEKIKNSPLLQDADIKNLLAQIKNTVRTNNNQSPQVTKQTYIKLDNKYTKQYYSTNHSENKPMIIESIQEKNNRLRDKNYKDILENLHKKYNSNLGYSLPRLSKLAYIGSAIESITRMPNSNNKNILLGALRETIKQLKRSLGNYPEFQEYERMMLA